MGKKKSKIDYLIYFCLLMGILLLTYPTISNYVNSFSSTRTISQYDDFVARMDDSQIKQEFQKALDYNQNHKIILGTNLNKQEKESYNSMLNVSNNGVMGYIVIPSVSIRLPIYHTTEESILQVGVGHVEWSSLPVGGEGTHCVLSGHRGLPSAKLFTDIVELKEEDYFEIEVLNEKITYEVDQILTVLPEDLDALKTEEGKDYCTLVTCTPYGVNSHRLLIRGHRIDNKETFIIKPDANRINNLIVSGFIAVPILILLWLMVVLKPERRKS